MDRAINIRIDNVTDYLFSGTDQEAWSERDFPNQAPPFPAMWIESRAPTAIRSDRPSERAKLRLEERPGIVGVIDAGLAANMSWGFLYLASHREDLPPEQRWEIVISYFLRDGRIITGPIAERRYFVAEDGDVHEPGLVLVDGGEAARYHEIALPDEDGDHIAVNALSPVFFPVQLAISFMHCKNVRSQEVLPTRQVRRSNDRRGEITVSYHVLDIGPMRTALETEGSSRTVGMQRALHICRGHFADYREERPLFGKYAGRFWIPSHVRGNADSGQVLKDYTVRENGGAAA